MSFDPYRDWLGISHAGRPIDHYQLLGLPWCEADLSRITAAADERLQFLRSLQHGPQGAAASQLMQEIAAAKICLLSPAKQAYDENLRPQLETQQLAEVTPAGELSAEAAGLLLPPAAMMGSVVQPVAAPPPIARRREPQASPPTASAWSQLWHQPQYRWGIIGGGAVLLGAIGFFIYYQSTANRRNNAVITEEPAIEITSEPDPQPSPIAVEPKPSGKNRPVIVRQEGNGELQFTAMTCRTSGQVHFQSLGTENILRDWGAKEDRLEWDFNIIKPDVFRLEITYAAPAEWEGAKYQVNISGEAKEFVVRSSGGNDKFHTDIFHFPIRRNGDHVLRIVATSLVGPEVMVFKSLRLIPGKAGN